MYGCMYLDAKRELREAFGSLFLKDFPNAVPSWGKESEEDSDPHLLSLSVRETEKGRKKETEEEEREKKKMDL